MDGGLGDCRPLVVGLHPCSFCGVSGVLDIFMTMIRNNTILTLADTPRRACGQSTDTGTT